MGIDTTEFMKLLQTKKAAVYGTGFVAGVLWHALEKHGLDRSEKAVRLRYGRYGRIKETFHSTRNSGIIADRISMYNPPL